jgi:hypothetical protein
MWFRLLVSSVAVAIFGYFGLAYLALLSMPLSDHLAYQALQRHLQASVADNNLLDLSPTKILHRNGEAILFGEASSAHPEIGQQGFPIIERLNVEYIVVIVRQCRDYSVKCYAAEQVELSGTKRASPLI